MCLRPYKGTQYGNGSPIFYVKAAYLIYSGSYFPVVRPAKSHLNAGPYAPRLAHEQSFSKPNSKIYMKKKIKPGSVPKRYFKIDRRKKE